MKDDKQLQHDAAQGLLAVLYGDDQTAREGSLLLSEIGSAGPVEFTGVMMTCALAVANVIRCSGPDDQPLNVAQIVQAEGADLPDDHSGLNAVRVIVAVANGDVPMAADIVGTYVDRVEIHGDDTRALDQVASFAAAMLGLGRSIVQALDADMNVTKLHDTYSDYDR